MPIRVQHLLLASMLILSLLSKGQQYRVEGRVVSLTNEPLVNVMVRLSGEQTVFYTNDEGSFSIPSDEQPKTLQVRAQGYEPKQFSLEYNYKEHLRITLNRILVEPFNADSIITKTIANRKLNELQTANYRGSFYKKNRGFIQKVPFEIPRLSGLYLPSQKDTGLIYTSERISNFSYNSLYHFKEEIVQQQEGGVLAVKDWNFLPDFDLSLYHNKVYFRRISRRGYYSPIGSKAFSYYQFTPLGTYYEGARKVYLIGFSPQRSYEAVMQGFIALYDSTYEIAYTDYTISPETQLEFTDSIHVKQNYGYVNDAYTLFNQRLDYRVDLVGFIGLYEIDLYYTQMEYISGDELDIERGPSQMRDSIIASWPDSSWRDLRAVPLLPKERYLLTHQNNNPKLKRLFPQDDLGLFEATNWKPYKIGYKKYYRRFGRYSIYANPLYYALGFNTVEGLYARYDLPIVFHQPSGSSITITPEIRFGSADNRLKYKLGFSWFYDLTEPNQLEIEFGQTYVQFNEDQPILPVINTFYSLFLGTNFLKLYQKDYVKIGHKWELFNGFDITGSFEYAHRKPIFNRTLYTITGDRDNYTFNNPVRAPDIFSNGFREHYALTGELNIFYRFNQLYKVVNGRKININISTKTPTLYLKYRKGFDSPWSDTKYDFVEGGITFSTVIGNIGFSSFDISTGKFLTNQKVPFIDYKHFNGVQTFFLQPTVNRSAQIKQFSTLPYYDFSTNNTFFELHYEHNFDGFLFSKSRYLRYSNIHSLVGFNYLNNYTQRPFLEFFLGLDNILHAVRIEFVGGIENFAKFNPSLRLGVDFDYLYYRKNKVKF
jgi:hypothetical protein